MGQRNENTLQDKLEEARELKMEYENELESSRHPTDIERLEMDIARCKHFIRFARWMLGQDKELEL